MYPCQFRSVSLRADTIEGVDPPPREAGPLTGSERRLRRRPEASIPPRNHSVTIAFDGTDSLLAGVDKRREVQEGVSQSPHPVGKPVDWKSSKPPYDFRL